MMAVLFAARERHSGFSPDPLRCPTAQRYYLEGPDVSNKSPMHDYSPSDCPSPATSSTPPSLLPSPDLTRTAAEPLPYTPASISSLSFNVAGDHDNEEIILPSFDAHDDIRKDQKEPEDSPSETSAELSTDLQFENVRTPAADDTSIEEEPSRHVDYLSHEWKEEDIWASWRYVVARKDVYSNGARLENASWRTWTKLKQRLGTISPETLNWLKDCDVTWLYGPLKTCNKRHIGRSASPPPSRLETPNMYLDKKSILKKKTASETILQRSLSQHTLLQHAGAILKAQEAESHRGRPALSRSTSEFGQMRNQVSCSTTSSIGLASTNATSSGMLSPNGRRHIHFNNEVSQCIAVEKTDWPTVFDDDMSWDYDPVPKRQIRLEAPVINQSSPRGSSSNENKTIAPLPSTTLKCRGDTPEPPPNSTFDSWSGSLWGSMLASKPSLETLRPSEPTANFLLDGDDDEDLDFSWQTKPSTYDSCQSRPWFVNPEDEAELEQDQHPESKSSDIHMSCDDAGLPNNGIFDRVVDTVNTARDIAHVIWNVGWRR